MRISTSTLYSEGVTAMQQMQSNLARTNLQIATGQRMLSPADDPAAAARAIELNQSDASNTQLASNRTAATNTLSLAEGVLSGVTSALQELKGLGVEAGGVMTNATSMKGIATTLRGRMQELLGLANSTDGVGNYLFSGGQGKVKPFVTTATGTIYQGDDVQRQIQVSASRQMAATEAGSDIFMRVRNGNGLFQTSAGATNTGTGIIDQGQALTARDPAVQAELKQAAQEETEHLAWTSRRVHELGGHLSLLNPLWYTGSLTLGAVAGLLGDKWNLGFLSETEHQVGGHLQSHLGKLPAHDEKSRAIVQQMYVDETKHSDMAKRMGGAELPEPVKFAMKATSKVLTHTAYRI